jgi:hypothetical protein
MAPADPEAAATAIVEAKPSKPMKWKSSKAKRVVFADIDPLIHHGYKYTLQPEDM